MSVRPEAEQKPSFACACRLETRSACKGLPFYKQHDEKRYCVLHYPGNEKGAPFRDSFLKKYRQKDFNFAGVWFPSDASFINSIFTTDANFGFATFNKGVDLRAARFQGIADFHGVTFHSTADFSGVVFEQRAVFSRASFEGEANFYWSIFQGDATFLGASFKESARFTGGVDRGFRSRAQLDLQYAKIAKPDEFSLHTLSLRPSWFVNVNSREFDFTNVDWRSQNVQEELLHLKGKLLTSRHELLAISCRNLAVNAEENRRYEDASKLRYMAMEAKRLEVHWTTQIRRLSWWYWLASGYGERVLQAFLMLLGILLLSAVLYNHVGFARWEPKLASESDVATAKRDGVGSPLPLPRALAYSAGVMTFQKPEPRPATTAAQTVVLLETILGPVQAALLALAIRRKFMR